jgi:hypothetical protein
MVASTSIFAGIERDLIRERTRTGREAAKKRGVRFVDQAITQSSHKTLSEIGTATPGSGLRTLIQQTILDKLTLLNGHNPPLPVAPIAGGEPGKIRDFVQQLIQPEFRNWRRI